MADDEYRKFQEAAMTGVGHPLGEMVYETQRQIKQAEKAQEDARYKEAVARDAAKKQQTKMQQFRPVTEPIGPTGQTVQPTRSKKRGRTWLDKVVLYAALLLGVVGFGLGFAAMSSLEGWRPLIGAGVGAGVGFAIPYGVWMAIEAVYNYIRGNLLGLGSLAVIAVVGGIGYLVLA